MWPSSIKFESLKNLTVVVLCVALIGCQNEIKKSELQEATNLGFSLSADCVGSSTTTAQTANSRFFEDAVSPKLAIRSGVLNANNICVANSSAPVIEEIDLKHASRTQFPVIAIAQLRLAEAATLFDQGVRCLEAKVFDSKPSVSCSLGNIEDCPIGSGSVLIVESTKAFESQSVSFSLLTHKAATTVDLGQGRFRLECK